MSTFKEILTIITFKFRGAFYCRIREELKNLLKSHTEKLIILDVGGRNSPYTCGLSGQYIVSDLIRESDIQHQLGLGITDNIFKNLTSHRSNIKEVVFDDMTKTKFLPNSFDGVIAIEVIEHIREDEVFIKNIYSILKPGGFLILTTPNGDVIPRNNPDHVRHYRLEELKGKLSKSFANITISYIVPLTRAHTISLSPWSYRRPFRTIKTMMNGYINFKQSKKNIQNKNNSVYLLARAQKMV